MLMEAKNVFAKFHPRLDYKENRRILSAIKE